MYLRTSEGVGQVPMRYGAFAGTLGEPPLPPTIQKFLARVKESPELRSASFDHHLPRGTPYKRSIAESLFGKL